MNDKDAAAAGEQIVNLFERGVLSRRQLVAQLLAVGAAGAGLALSAHAADAPATAQASTFTATQIDHLALSVTDVKRSSAFYQKHLGLKVSRDGESSTFLNCGERDFLALFRGEKPGLHHFSFSIPKYNADDAGKRIEAAGLKLRREGNRVYFPDPDGLIVQVHN